MKNHQPTTPHLFWPRLVTGLGLLALLDVIIIHMVLQWHSMISSLVPPVDIAAARSNLLADGAVSLVATLAVVVGLVWERWGDARRAWPGFASGFTLMALLDVFVFHMLLQWHHLVSSRIDTATLEGLWRNVRIDGVFTLAMLLALAFAVLRGWRTEVGQRPARRVVIGRLLAGGAAFNLFDAVVSHALLGLHHVRAGADSIEPELWFALFGIVVPAALAWRLLARTRN